MNTHSILEDEAVKNYDDREENKSMNNNSKPLQYKEDDS